MVSINISKAANNRLIEIAFRVKNSKKKTLDILLCNMGDEEIDIILMKAWRIGNRGEKLTEEDDDDEYDYIDMGDNDDDDDEEEELEYEEDDDEEEEDNNEYEEDDEEEE